MSELSTKLAVLIQDTQVGELIQLPAEDLHQLLEAQDSLEHNLAITANEYNRISAVQSTIVAAVLGISPTDLTAKIKQLEAELLTATTSTAEDSKQLHVYATALEKQNAAYVSRIHELEEAAKTPEPDPNQAELPLEAVTLRD